MRRCGLSRIEGCKSPKNSSVGDDWSRIGCKSPSYPGNKITYPPPYVVLLNRFASFPVWWDMFPRSVVGWLVGWQVGGVRTKEANALESHFLQLIEWKLHVTPEAREGFVKGLGRGFLKHVFGRCSCSLLLLLLLLLLSFLFIFPF